MAMSKMYVKRSRYQTNRKKPTNKKLATIGTVKRLINHNVDQTYVTAQAVAAQNVTTTAVLTNLTNSISGADLIMKFFKVKSYLTNPTLNVSLRILFFQWKDTTTPIISDILRYTTDTQSPIGAGVDGESCGGKMHLLKDYHFVMDPVLQTNKVIDFVLYDKKLLDLKSDGSETKNQLYVCYLSNTAATPPVFSLDTLIKYHNN